MNNITSTIRTNLINVLGVKTPRIIVFESDDWGSLRMPNKEVYDTLVKQGFEFSSMPYERVDSIATEDDLTALFQILSKYSDSLGNHPIFTALSVSANPDFEKIKESGFEKYYYVSLDETLTQYSKTTNLKELWKEGIRSGVFYPQFHGREHLNVPRWMRDLKKEDCDNRLVFDYGIPGFFERSTMQLGNPYAKAFRHYSKEDLDFVVQSVKEGLTLFEELWGYKSLTLMSPAYTWNDDVEKAAYESGVKYLQTAFYQHKSFETGTKVVHHFFGQKNKFGQRYLLRNCSFEPIQNGYSNCVVDNCLKEIEIAFIHKKPATISSHRLNYIGRLDVNNRDKSLRLLDTLLGEVVKRWPDAIFMNSAMVGSKYLERKQQ